jgi:hypothetical protein
MIKGMSGLVSNESAHTTDGEERWLSSRSGRCLMNYLSEHGFTSHSPPPSIIPHQARPRTATRRDAIPHAQTSSFRAAIYGTGKSPSSPSCREQLGSGDDARVLWYRPFSASLFALRVRSRELLGRLNDCIRTEPPVRPRCRCFQKCDATRLSFQSLDERSSFRLPFFAPFSDGRLFPGDQDA